MTEQIRSADLLLRSALSSPETLDALKNNPQETLRSLAKDAIQSLPRVLPDPNPMTNNAIWLIVVVTFAAVMLGAAYILGVNVTTELDKEATYVTNSQMILTVFTTVVAFLAGLLAPSPVKK